MLLTCAVTRAPGANTGGCRTRSGTRRAPWSMQSECSKYTPFSKHSPWSAVSTTTTSSRSRRAATPSSSSPTQRSTQATSAE